MIWLGLLLSAKVPHHEHETLPVKERVVKRAGKRCARGHLESCARLGLLAAETGVAEGEMLVGLACAGGEQVGCINQVAGAAAGYWLVHPAALAATVAACARGVASACHAVGDLMALVDDPVALQAMDKSCELGVARDCANAFDLRRQGGLQPDPAQLEQACEGGVQCGYLGAVLVFGWFGAERDLERGVVLAAEGCEQGDLVGCHAVAWATDDDAWLGRSCQAGGDDFACDLYGTMLRAQDRDVEADRVDLALCEGGSSSACTRAAVHTEDKRRRLEFSAMGCDLGDDLACGIYGRALLEGWGTDPQPRAARPLLEQSCQAGNQSHCNSLALLHADGCGVEVDVDRGLELAEQVCEADYLPGCVNRGEIGWHVRGRDDGEPYLRHACESGRDWGCGTLGSLLVEQGQPEERQEGIALLEQACSALPDSPWCVLWHFETLDAEPQNVAHLEQACAQAESSGACKNGELPWSSQDYLGCTLLGELYEEGRHVVRDEVYARSLYTRACEGDDYRACRALEAMGPAPQPSDGEGDEVE